MGSVTLKEALNHPNWRMGTRITIDSASMFNKSLELIEAMHLFELEFSDVAISYTNLTLPTKRIV